MREIKGIRRRELWNELSLNYKSSKGRMREIKGIRRRVLWNELSLNNESSRGG